MNSAVLSHPSVDALASALAMVRGLRKPLDKIQAHDHQLADQLRDAASSIPLSLAQSSGRSGRDRLHCYRRARGSTLETAAALEAALSGGYISWLEVDVVLFELSRLRAMLWRLVRVQA